MGFGSGMTCWRRLRDWNEAGVWQRLHELLLSELWAADLLDFSRAAADSSHIRAMKGGCCRPCPGSPGMDRWLAFGDHFRKAANASGEGQAHGHGSRVR